MAPRHWLLQLLIALDQLLNVLITPLHGGAWADETLSSRAWRMDQAGKPWGRLLRPVVDALFRLFGEKDHCRQSFESERDQRQLPPAGALARHLVAAGRGHFPEPREIVLPRKATQKPGEKNHE